MPNLTDADIRETIAKTAEMMGKQPDRKAVDDIYETAVNLNVRSKKATFIQKRIVDMVRELPDKPQKLPAPEPPSEAVGPAPAPVKSAPTRRGPGRPRKTQPPETVLEMTTSDES
jgi:hypothetical protein